MNKLIPGCLLLLAFARLTAQNPVPANGFIYTDRQVYRVSDEILFSSFTGSAADNKGLFAFILDHEGKKISEGTFPLKSGWTSGSIPLPDSLKPGVYSVNAAVLSTPGEDARAPLVYPLLITDKTFPEMMLWLGLDASSYQPGEFAQLSVNVGFLNEKLKFGTGDVNYFASKNGVPFQSGFDKTDENGKLSVLIRIPATPDPGIITVNANAAFGEMKGSSTIRIPVLHSPDPAKTVLSDPSAEVSVSPVPGKGKNPDLEGIIIDGKGLSQGSRVCVSVVDDIASPVKDVVNVLTGEELFHSLYLEQGAGFTNYLRKNKSKLVASGVIPSAEGSSNRVKEQLQMGIPILVVLRSVKPYTQMGGMIMFRGNNSMQYEKGALFVIDGVEKGYRTEVLDQYSPYDIENIKVSLETSDILKYSADGAGGIIFITTKDASKASPEKSRAAPKYSPTLYWNPGISLQPGNPVQIQLPKSAIHTLWRIEVRGITAEGHPINQISYFPNKNF
jgi:hypothetical protein